MKSLIKNLVLVLFLTVVSQVYAQHQITGKLVSQEDNSPLEFASVVLQTKDSVYVTGISSDESGKFQFKNVASGDYIITATFIGFSPTNIALNNFSKSVELGDIFMTEESHLLDAVTVTASNVTNKSDRMIVFVTDRQKAASSNGVNLLLTMDLPRLTVNPMTNEVSLPGEESIQFCINGAKVEHSEIRALQPDHIIRVEYLDNPGLRYGNVDVVINYVLKREEFGGSVSMDLTNAVTTSFGDDQVAAKFNYKKSEFGINYSVRYRNPEKIWTDQERTFNFADGSQIKRIDKGLPTDMSENSHNIRLNYNLLDDGKYYFNATLRYSLMDDDKMSRSRQYISTLPEDITNVYQGSDTRQHLPSIDLYYSRTLKNRQTLVFNLVGTYINSDISQKYEEKENDLLINDIVSDINGKKYSIIGEGIYEKMFENGGRFTAGLKHTQAFANNDYSGTVTSHTKMDQADSYIYAEYARKVGKFSYIGGAGLARSWAKQKGEDEYSYYTFRPKVTLQYDITRGAFIRLRGEIFNSTPSLSRLSAVDQYIDNLQIMRGNPALKANLNYLANLSFNWKKDIYGINFMTSYHYVPDAVMEETLRENNMFIQTFDNQKNWQKINSELTLNVGPVKKILTVSLTGGVNRFISTGNNYLHTNTNFYYRLQMMGMYKKFMGIFQAGSPYDNFSGESLNGGEKMHLFMLMYNAGKFTAGAGIMMPFSDQYKREAENRGQFSPSKINMYANDFSRMVMLKFSWNFNFGRKIKGASKRLNNQDTDSGIMSTK